MIFHNNIFHGPNSLSCRYFIAGDEHDHPIEDDLMTVIWAHGQQHFKYNHRPLTGLEFCTVRDIFFYRKDVPMYHGHRGSRGATSLNLVSDPNAANGKYRLLSKV